MKTLIIIPTYNERENILALVPALFKTVPDIDVLVVDDHSPDGTAKVVHEFMQKYPRLHILSRPGKQGLGKAYMHAFTEALKDPQLRTIVTMDADFSHHPAYLPAMLAASTSAQLVIGSRYVKGGSTEGWELYRRILSRFGNLYCRMVTRMPAHDFTAGFTVMDAGLLRKVIAQGLASTGYAFLIELKYRLWQEGARIAEVPIVFRNRTEGESKLNGHIISEGIIAPWKIIIKKKQAPQRFLTVLFGPIGDTLMALALCDDILRIAPNSTILILTRRNAKIISDLASSYPALTVRQIPGGIRAIPFFLKILTKRWTMLTLGVTGEYSFRVKCFFWALSFLPGNRTIGFNDHQPGVRTWLPLQTIVQFDESHLIIDNFRMLLRYVFGEEVAASLMGKPPRVALRSALPAGFALQNQAYIATNVFSASALRSLPLYRWKALFKKIAEQWPQYPLVLMGGPNDAAAIAELQKVVPHSVALPGAPLLEAAGVIDAAALYIGVDTGITHLAGVLQQKSLVLSHNSIPTWLPLYNPHARVLVNSARCVCSSREPCIVDDEGTPRLRCLYDISDAFVLESVGIALSSPARDVSLFVGFVDEQSGKANRKHDSQYVPDQIPPEASE